MSCNKKQSRKRLMRLEQRQTPSGRWWGKVIAGNGECLARTAYFGTRKKLVDALVGALESDASVLVAIRRKRGDYRWGFPSKKPVLMSSEGYKNRHHCYKMAVLVLTAGIEV